ncbi:MAG: lysophospholipid acyltransferase family protein [Candidatus Omnitrophica bacterium]|nr:lysophospholipid acyltransferase family protein [Candidatus Omnitrophota bacterium]
MRGFKKLLWCIDYFFFRGLASALSILPLRVCYRMADFSGMVAFRVFGIRRGVIMQNLRLAFGDEKNDPELLAIGEASMRSLVKLGVEFVRTPQVSRDPERYLEPPDMAPLLNAVAEYGHFIAVVSHFGNWEWLSIPLKPFGLFVHAVGRPLKNPYLYRYIRRTREAANLRNIDKSGAVRASIQVLKQKGVLAALIDQHESRGAVRVKFFGREASTSSLPAMLALKYGCPVLPAFFYRNERGRSKIRYGPVFPRIRTGRFRDDLVANTQQYVSRIEEEIRLRPGDWLWAHRRWR